MIHWLRIISRQIFYPICVGFTVLNSGREIIISMMCLSFKLPGPRNWWYMRHQTRPSLIPKMDWRQWWFIANWTLGNRFKWNLDKNTTLLMPYKKTNFKMSCANWRPFCASHNVLTLKFSEHFIHPWVILQSRDVYLHPMNYQETGSDMQYILWDVPAALECCCEISST